MSQRLLIVDSDRRFIKDHQVALESAFDVDFVNTTDAVPARLASGQYSGVLICVEVNENKGYALCSTLRRTPEFSHVKIGLISAKATEEEYSRHRSLKGRSADVYLRKPIDSSALVSELSPLAPLRAVDPDNPLGDLSGNDMGEEWLDNLKSGIEVEAPSTPAPQILQPPFPIAPVPIVPAPIAPALLAPPVPIINLPLNPIAAGLLPPPPRPQPVHQDAGKMELLETRVKDLEAKLSEMNTQVEDQKRQIQEQEVALQDKGGQLEDTLQILEQLKSDRAQSVSKDELQKAQDERQTLESKLKDIEELCGTLETKLKDSETICNALESRTRQAEEESKEFKGRCEALEGAKNDLQSEFQSRSAQLESLEAAKATAENRAQDLERSREQGDRRLDELLLAKDSAERQAVALVAEKNGLEKQITELNSQIEHMKGQVRSSDSVFLKNRELEEELVAHGARIQAIQQHADEKNNELAERIKEIDALKVDIAGLEATLRGQRRELADQGGKLTTLTRECDSLQAKAGKLESESADLQLRLDETAQSFSRANAENIELKNAKRTLEDKLASLEYQMAERVEQTQTQIASLKGEHEARLADQSQEHARLQREKRAEFEAQLAAQTHEFEESISHERESRESQVLELMKAIEEREGQIRRMDASIETLRERLVELEQDKQTLEQTRRSLEGHLNEKTARLEALTGAISDLEVGIRRATDLTRPL